MPDTGPPQQGEDVPGLAAKVAFLRRPDSYPEETARVEALETHMSWVFLTERHAYKLKKPFRRGPIDYSTLAARRRSCARELRLNRRLAPEIYLAVVALTVDASGRIGLGGAGRPIDWLVQMQRLPAELTLECRLRANTVDAADARRIVARLVPFFAAAPRARWTPAAYRRRLVSAVDAAAGELTRPELGLARSDIDPLATALRQFVATRGEVLDARVRSGRIVEGHGDLRPEHIYLTEPPTFMDCIEFDRGLRLRDPVDELAFLVMECDRLGRPELDGWLFAAYCDLVGDTPPRALIELYKAHNAFIRARIAVGHLDELNGDPTRRWTSRAKDYLDHARSYLALL